jgi:probable HAF family extracellular repeat protein
MSDVGALPGDFFALAQSNNDNGQVVGFSFSATDFRAFLWQNGVMVDLNTLIPPDSPLLPFLANDINDRGGDRWLGVPAEHRRSPRFLSYPGPKALKPATLQRGA